MQPHSERRLSRQPTNRKDSFTQRQLVPRRRWHLQGADHKRVQNHSSPINFGPHNVQAIHDKGESRAPEDPQAQVDRSVGLREPKNLHPFRRHIRVHQGDPERTQRSCPLPDGHLTKCNGSHRLSDEIVQSQVPIGVFDG